MKDINKKIIKAVSPIVEFALMEFENPSLEERDEIVRAKVKEFLSEHIEGKVSSAMLAQVNEEQIVSTIRISTCKWDYKVQVISDPTNHIAWLTEEKKSGWSYWPSYAEYLEGYLDDSTIENLDDSTDRVIEQLEDPCRNESWDRRGLVVGHVQSGKTGHYTGLVAKAADAGYKIIIVLAGLHNNLRAQTQLRLESGFLGFETDEDGETGRSIGVGNIRAPGIKPNAATNRSEKGDFNKSKAKSIQGISPEEKPWIFVVKKNKSVLEHLLNWIKKRVTDSEDSETGKAIVDKLPLLIIDDEADNASVDTKEQVYTQDDEVDSEHNPTAINSLIRQIMHVFSRKAYIGYTATPFANVFIHNKNETKREGKDLFPNSFIVNLIASSNYVGPSFVFSEKGQRLFTRSITDNVDNKDAPEIGWMPNKHKSNHIPLYESQAILPPSLKEAIHSFILACCTRRYRGDGDEHWSMLVHVTRFNNVQGIVSEQVSTYVKSLKQKLARGIGQEDILDSMRELWNRDFKKVNEALLPEDNVEEREFNIKNFDIKCLPEFDVIEENLLSVLNEIRILTINGLAKDALMYEEFKEVGLKVIAIGGDKLSRGLTLEGLMTSYFLRASKMYDTLMQMGRWFGYRPRYLDLCRLYTTDDLTEWFSQIAIASEELREEFDIMVAKNQRPHEYGLKVQSHPGLLVTSPLKMRAAKEFKLSFSGDTSETVAFSNVADIIKSNTSAMEALINDIPPNLITKSGYSHTNYESKFNGIIFDGVKSDLVINFLEQYQTHPDSYKSNSSLISKFIEQMNSVGELTNWTIAIAGGDKSNQTFSLGDITLHASRRAKLLTSDDRKISIRRLLDPKHELLGTTELQYQEALSLTVQTWKNQGMQGEQPSFPKNTNIRYVKGKGLHANRTKALLILYMLEIRNKNQREPDNKNLVPAFGVSFPASNSGVKVPYIVNNVLQQEWNLEYGGSE